MDVFRFKLHSNNMIGKIAFRYPEEYCFCLKEMMLSTMSHDSLFHSLFTSRPAAEKIHSDGMDVEGHAWQSLRF